MKTNAEKFQQKRKLLLALPALVLPFVTMIFWALGGGPGKSADAHPVHKDGLNIALPDAYFDGKESWDKLSLYEAAERDSDEYREARESDPYFDLIAFKTKQEESALEDSLHQNPNQLINSFKQRDRLSMDPNEERINNKLAELYAELNKANTDQHLSEVTSPIEMEGNQDPQFTTDVDRLESMMSLMEEDGQPDPEMQQIENMLEKILDIQHPERIKHIQPTENAKAQTETWPVSPTNTTDATLLIPPAVTAFEDSTSHEMTNTTNEQNGFFGLNDGMQVTEQSKGNIIEAVVHNTQELVTGSVIKIRVVQDIQIANHELKKDQFIFGVCSINGERLNIDIKSIKAGNLLLPVALKVYDMDGLPGIFIPGAISRDAAKQASDDAIQNMDFNTMSPSLGIQAAGVGLEAAKGVFSKKVKLVKVTVKAGYQILLADISASGGTN